MCDTLCALLETGSLFGKNSDRPVGEPQVFESYDRRPAGGELSTQYLTIPDRGACALVGSRPTWLWGLEHGVNEHRVAVGNEKLWTADDPRKAPDALIGMDLVRLGLERGRTAAHALDAMTDLLEAYGQGGICDQITGDRYFSSFLIADPNEAWVLETMGRQWAARRVRHGGVAISNRITMNNDFWKACDSVQQDDDIDAWRHPTAPTGHADRRLAVTRGAVEPSRGGDSFLQSGGPSPTPSDFMAILRDHDDESARERGHIQPLPGPVANADGEGVTVCMHLRDYQTTAGSMVVSLPRDPAGPVTVWAALATPCVSVYAPLTPWVGPSRSPSSTSVWLGEPTYWHRFDRLRQWAEVDADALPAIRAVLDPLERGSISDPADGIATEEIEDALRRLGR